jgi:hypothetical protein
VSEERRLKKRREWDGQENEKEQMTFAAFVSDGMSSLE